MASCFFFFKLEYFHLLSQDRDGRLISAMRLLAESRVMQ